MSVKSNPGTGSQAEGSKISDTTEEEDKGENRVVIDWLARADPEAVFLETPERSSTYGEVLEEVTARPVSGVEVVRPGLDFGSAIGLISVMARGSAVVLPPHLPDPGPVEPAGAVTVLYTSGTTGPPRGVRLTRANWEAAARASVEHLGHGADDVWLLALPLHHVAGLSILVRSAFAAGRVRMLPRFDPDTFAVALREGVTMTSLVPTMLRRLLDSYPGPYDGMRAVLVGGGPIPDGLLERARDAGLPVLPTYGLTETCGQVATLRPGSAPEKRAHPLPGVEVMIGGDGRIRVRGSMVSPGYLGEPDRSPGEWLVTEDLGSLDPDGALRVAGRADTVIVTGGEKVSPEQVEAALGEVAGVEAALVVGLPSEEWGTELACLYAGPAQISEVAGALREQVPGHMVPKRWLRVDRLPVTPLGKPDRRAGAALFSRS